MVKEIWLDEKADNRAQADIERAIKKVDPSYAECLTHRNLAPLKAGELHDCLCLRFNVETEMRVCVVRGRILVAVRNVDGSMVRQVKWSRVDQEPATQWIVGYLLGRLDRGDE